VHARQTDAVGLVDAFAERIEAFGAGGTGVFDPTKSPAASFSAPVASPFSSRTIFPLGGSGVLRSMPAMASALVLAQELWPSKATDTRDDQARCHRVLFCLEVRWCKCWIGPAHALYPGVIGSGGMSVGVGFDALLDFGDGGGAIQIHARETSEPSMK